MSKTDYDSLSVEELEDKIHTMEAERAAMGDEIHAVHKVLEAKILAADAQRRIANLSDTERVALLQSLTAAPVESEETLGTPGQ